MSLPLHVVVVGLIIGLTYGLLAVGLVLVYKSNRVLNFAHGELGALSAVLVDKLVNDFGAPYWAALVGALMVGAALGGATELLLRRLFRAPRFLVMVATIGLAQVLFVVSILPAFQPEDGAAPYPVPFSFKGSVDGFLLQPSHFTILVFAPLVAIALAVFFARTKYGLGIRAAAENADSARLGGIWVRRMSTLSWTLAGFLAATTAILVAPFQANVFAQALGPTLMVRALAAALLGAMVNLRVAFLAGVGVGVVEQMVLWNRPVGGTVEAVMFGLLLLALVVRGRSLRTSARTEERSSWKLGEGTRLHPTSLERQRVGQVATGLALVAALVLPLVLGNAQAFLFSRMFVLAIVAISLTLLSGWAGQLSLGHFGFVAVGAVVAARWGESLPLPVLLVVAGAITALVAAAVGLPALRIRGLYLAVVTLGFAVVMHGWVLGQPAFGLPDPASTLLDRPSLLGVDLGPQRSYYYFALVLLVAVIAVTARLRRSAIGRAIIAVRDNEAGAAAMGIRVARTKLTAFAISGFLAGVAGVAFAYAQERFSTTSFDPLESIAIVAMAVIGGMGSIRGAVLGAVYLLGIPAAFGYGQLAQFLTGGIGLTVFILYLPSGLGGVLDRLGDLAVRSLGAARAGPEPRPTEKMAA